ncbi:isocitrate lyase/PEP mutase family protein [Paraburkholderia sp.]|uniref:isocitrate lyase/PEP mutase family protein n=1 Tax=Paraburkholderia sp. TaxID=1926495 RepID=UPI0039E23D08
MSKRKQLRELISAPDILVMPGVFDGYSTRLLGASGFAAGFVTGAGVSEASLGWADQGIMGLEENLRVTRALAACADVPLIADADTGYGNAVNVHFTVRAFENAGLAGVMIEDQVWPKRCGHMKGKQVISAEEGMEKIRAAAEARVDPDLLVMSRTDSLATHGIAEVIKRLNMYAEAGADLLFADALLATDHITMVVRNVSRPVCVNMGFGIRQRSTTPLISARQLQELGVAVVVYPRLLTAAAIQGMKNAIATLKESVASGNVIERPDLVVSFEELNELVGIDELERIEQRYLTPEQYQQKYEGASYEKRP